MRLSVYHYDQTNERRPPFIPDSTMLSSDYLSAAEAIGRSQRTPRLLCSFLGCTRYAVQIHRDGDKEVAVANINARSTGIAGTQPSDVTTRQSPMRMSMQAQLLSVDATNDCLAERAV